MRLRGMYKSAVLALTCGMLFQATGSCSSQLVDSLVTNLTPAVTTAVTTAVTGAITDAIQNRTSN
jgi:hypothetical protein